MKLAQPLKVLVDRESSEPPNAESQLTALHIYHAQRAAG
jgi:hypothetical protein